MHRWAPLAASLVLISTLLACAREDRSVILLEEPMGRVRLPNGTTLDLSVAFGSDGYRCPSDEEGVFTTCSDCGPVIDPKDFPGLAAEGKIFCKPDYVPTL